MCDSLYVKANGEMPCWDDVGESRILRRLAFHNLANGEERELFADPQILHIRRSFMNHKVPFPGLCEGCAVLEHGPSAVSLRPAAIHILHIEPSYLCHLSCPQCIPSVDRKNLADPPYNMPVVAFEALLKQLQTDGVQDIEVIHFEGRGDPLMNTGLGNMIRLARVSYPLATTMVTTHGSYLYKPELLANGLQVLRVSIDGAFPESYKKYRVGGDLEKALRFLERLRDDRRRQTNDMTVYWKYILFEWNDSDEEIRYAGELAKALDVSLLFTLTHTPGRSRRFRTEAELQNKLKGLAPKARTDTTFPLRDSSFDVSAEREKIVRWLAAAKTRIEENDERNALGLIFQALNLDCGIQPAAFYTTDRELIRAYIPLLLKSGRYPETLSNLAPILYAWGERPAAIALLNKYVRTITTMGLPAKLWLVLRLRVQFRTRCRIVMDWIRNLWTRDH